MAAVAAAMGLAACGGGDGGPAGTATSGARPLALAVVPAAEVAACREVAADVAPARCPLRLPTPTDGLDVEGTGDFASRGCGWLRGLAYENSDAPVFHVLVGASCASLPLDDLGRVAAGEDLLRLVGERPQRPGDRPGARAPALLPAVRGHSTVRGRQAVVLRWAGYERAGTVHGGHDGLAWNEDGAGRVVSLHFGEGVPAAVRLATLRAVAASMR